MADFNWSETVLGARYALSSGGDNGDGTQDFPIRFPDNGSTSWVLGRSNYEGEELFSATTGAFQRSIIGDDRVVFDGRFISRMIGQFSTSSQGEFGTMENLRITNYSAISTTSTSSAMAPKFINCEISNVTEIIDNAIISRKYYFSFQNTLSRNVTELRILCSTTNSGRYNQNTIVGSQDVYIDFENSQCLFHDNLFSGCGITIEAHPLIETTVFNTNCTFLLMGGNQSNDETQRTAASGATPAARLASMKDRAVAVYGGSPDDYFNNCVFDDPLFVNETRENYALRDGSPALSSGYNRQQSGKYGRGFELNFSATEANSDFLNSAATNSTITDDSLTYASTASNFNVRSKPFFLQDESEMLFLRVAGQVAHRNGEAISRSANLSSTIISPGTSVLTTNALYVVIGDVVQHDGASVSIGRTFYARNSQDFTSTGSATVREILNFGRSGIGLRLSTAETSATTSGNVVLNDWYVVLGTAGQTVVYDGVTYQANNNTFVQGTATTTYTGTASLFRIFESTDSFFDSSMFVKPVRVNRTGDVATGTVTNGNASPTYDFGDEFPYLGVYGQIDLTGQHDNFANV